MKFSIVISTKNDEKHLVFLSVLPKLLELDAEIIVVDWGSEIPIKLPDKIRTIHVVPEIVKKYSKDSYFTLAISSNVGIRRATGEYIIYFGNDTFCDDKMLPYLSTIVDDKTFFIIGRRHIKSPDTMETFTQSKVSRGWGASGAWVAHRNIWHTLRGFDEKFIYYGFMDREIVWRSQMYGVNVRIVNYAMSVYHVDHPRCYMRTHRMENEILFSKEELKPKTYLVNDENWGLWNEHEGAQGITSSDIDETCSRNDRADS